MSKFDGSIYSITQWLEGGAKSEYPTIAAYLRDLGYNDMHNNCFLDLLAEINKTINRYKELLTKEQR